MNRRVGQWRFRESLRAVLVRDQHNKGEKNEKFLESEGEEDSNHRALSVVVVVRLVQ